MSADTARLQRLARQHLETGRLLGVEFVPVNLEVAAPVTPTRPPAATVETRERGPAARSDQMSLAAAVDEAPPEPAPEAKPAALEALRERHEATCPHCTTATAHTRTVFGEGDPDADLLFVGEAPGRDEDRTGRPFVGRAGQKLDDMIAAMGLQRGQVYIANILKSRPPDNRTPLPIEIDRCSPFLAEQILIIRPRVIVALGGPASNWLIGTTVGITRLRGEWCRFHSHGLSIPIMPTFHPAYLLRNYTRETRAKVWSDMQAVMSKLGLKTPEGRT